MNAMNEAINQVVMLLVRALVQCIGCVVHGRRVSPSLLFVAGGGVVAVVGVVVVVVVVVVGHTHRQTDRQTDRQTERQTHRSSSSSGCDA